MVTKPLEKLENIMQDRIRPGKGTKTVLTGSEVKSHKTLEQTNMVFEKINNQFYPK